MKVLKVLAILSVILFISRLAAQADEPAKALNSIYESWDVGVFSASTHKWITEDAANLLINKEGARYVELRAFIRELKKGATREDDGVVVSLPYDRSYNHYYDPVTKKGKHASSIGWALGTEKDGDKENNFTFSKALQEYENARLSYSKWEGWNCYETYGAYRCIGNVLHLLQDISVPWHTTFSKYDDEGHGQYESYLGADGVNNNHDNYKTFAKLAKGVAKPDLFARYGYNYQGATTEIFHDLAVMSHGKTYGQDRFGEIATELVPKAIEYSAGLMKYFYDYVDAIGWTGMRDRDTHKYAFIRDVSLGDTIKIYTNAGELVMPKVVARNFDNGVTPWDGLNSAGKVCAYNIYTLQAHKLRFFKCLKIE